MRLIYRNLQYYKRYYILIALAIVLANTIITGSLFVGDSVKQTLISRVDERLGRSVSLITSGSGFMDEALAGDGAAVFFTNGFVSHGLSLLPVSVWGVDSSILTIVGQGFVSPDRGEVVLNRKTANELSLKAGDYLVIRLPNTSMIPSGSLFVTDNYTTSLRLRVKAVIDSRQSGNLNLRNEQSLPFNLFVNRQELTTELEMEGKNNIILLNRKLSADELSELWNPAISGITVEKREPLPNPPHKGWNNSGYHEVVSEGIFLDKDLITRLEERFPQTNRLFSYLVNDISIVNCQLSIPYSFVTAIDHFGGNDLKGDDMILTDYTARRLNASIGDTVSLAFFVSEGFKILTELRQSFVVRDIIPIEVFYADGRLSAEFPGLYDVDNCTDWDSDLPIDMVRIEKEDEDYWDMYRTTPKALIAYSTGSSLWSNNYGVATAVRISSPVSGLDPDSGVHNEEIILDDFLSPADVGITLVSPREIGLAAAQGGVDFKTLFLSLAFFVIVAALLLATVPLSGMLHDRRKELLLLQALGYTQKRIKNILLKELVVITIAATFLGMLVAVFYNRLVLFALGNIWKGAVHTENFITSIEPASLVIGSLISLAICFVTVWFTLRRILKSGTTTASVKIKPWLPIFFLILMHVLIFVNFATVKSPVLYMATGLTALIASILGYAHIINRRAINKGFFNQKSIVYKNLRHRMRNGIISVAVLSSGLFVVCAVGLNRVNFADSSSLLSGTGGFTLWGENSVPLYHSLSTPEGRARFGLSDLPENVSILQFYRRGGDDASCLNLNKAPQPTILGVDTDLLSEASFTFASTYEKLEPWETLTQKIGDYYPVIADQTVLQWGLMKSVGDTIIYLNRKGEPVVLMFIGGLNNSIFQGNILIDKQFFSEIWGEDGSEVMLVQTFDPMPVKQLLSQALANYGLQLGFCNERLKEFNSVIDSYLTIFLMLGGLGLLIGLFGMLLIIRRGLLDRAKEISTLSAVGFDIEEIKRQLFRESMIVPLYAIITGIVAALVAVTYALPAVSLFTWATMVAIIVLLVAIAWIYTKSICNTEIR